MKNLHTSAPWTYLDRMEYDSEIAFSIVQKEGNNDIICKISKYLPEAEANAKLMAAAPELLQVVKNALSDLEGIMPEFEPSGDRTHSAWKTIKELKEAIIKATEGK